MTTLYARENEQYPEETHSSRRLGCCGRVFPPEEIRVAYQAGNSLITALQSEGDSATLKRCRPPIEVFEFLGKWYEPENEVTTQQLFDKLLEFSIPQNSNLIAAFHALEDITNQI